MEEFANISSNVVLENESTARVLFDEFLNIKNHLIENDKLATKMDGIVELASCHGLIRHDKFLTFAQNQLVSNLSIQKPNKEESRR